MAGIAHHTEPVAGQENDLVFEWASPEDQGKRRSEIRAARLAVNIAQNYCLKLF
jgi:hypothetical protein